MKEIDLEKHYAKAKKIKKLDELKPGSKIKLLIEKIMERNKELTA